jgi:hypothetical protein
MASQPERHDRQIITGSTSVSVALHGRPQTRLIAGFEILTTAVMKVTVFWDIAPCRLYVNLASCHHSGFLLGRFFYLEDGGDNSFVMLVHVRSTERYRPGESNFHWFNLSAN